MGEHSGFFNGIRIKVLIGFGVGLLAVAVAAAINFISLNRMTTSVETLAEPDKKVECMRQLMTHLDNEEANARAFTLTGDSFYLTLYRQFTDSVYHRLAQLKSLTRKNENQIILADSVTRLVTQREALMNQFIERRTTTELEKEIQESKLEKESSAKNQALSADQSTRENKQKVSNDYVAAEGTEEKKGFFSFNWLKGDKDKRARKEAKDGESNTNTILKSNEAENNLVTAEAIIRQEEQKLQQQLTTWNTDEFYWVQQNTVIVNRIRSSLASMEENVLKLREEQSARASKTAKLAGQYMKFIGVLGILSTLLFISLILRDISRSNSLRAQLVEERRHAEELARVKQEFLANMSHEIRTPLHAIVGFTELLNYDSEKKQNYIEAIRQSSDHLLSLVNQVLDYSRLDAKKMQPEERSFDVHQLVREVYETFRLKADEKKIHFLSSVEETVPYLVVGDSMMMKQILLNLVSNAIKFTQHGRVSIQVSAAGEQEDIIKIRTTVQDTGIGISAATTEKIFAPFTQSDGEITRKFGGTGLGLTITKKLTELMGGTIAVKSNEGSGSEFSVIIPFKKALNQSAEEEEVYNETKIHPVLNPKTILVVDDEEMNVLLCKTILESHGMKTILAHSGKEALEKFETEKIDLILLDIQMPELSGFDVAKAIRNYKENNKKRNPIIALTANVYIHQQKEFIESGFTDSLVKPFKERDLLEKIKPYLSEEEGFDPLKSSLDSGTPPHHQAYNLKYLENLSGSNAEFIVEMLKTFVQNSRKHLMQLKSALTLKDYETIQQIVHKMTPSFRHLQINKVEEKLKRLEKVAAEKTSREDISTLTEEIIIDSEKILPLLENEISERQVNYQSSIPHQSVAREEQ